jgi:tetratricopeptide (TPR) repeat protein/transglutaminase-like putative cysteine protease
MATPFRLLRQVLPLAILLASVGLAQSQSPFSASPESLLALAAANKPAGEPGVHLLRMDQRLSFDAQGRSTYYSYRIFHILTEEDMESWSTVGASWAPWHQDKPTLRARVITPDGRQHLLDPATINEGPTREYSRDIFSDRRALRAPLPAIAIGAVVEFEAITRDTAPLSAAGTTRSFTLDYSIPLHKLNFTISAPASLPLHVTTYLLPDSATRRTESAGIVTYNIEQSTLPAAPPSQPLLPSNHRTRPSLEVSTGKNWQSVAAHYASQVDAQIRSANVATLLAAVPPNTSRDEILRAALATLHREVRYTGLEIGEASLVPATPADVLKRHYGDCKDKAALLVAMLRARNINAHVALLSTGPGLDVDPAHPGLGGFDHAIVYIPGTPALWIDATATYAPAGTLPAADRNRLALVANPATTALLRTPALLAGDNLSVETREIVLPAQGKSRIIETATFSPHAAISLRESYASSDPKELRKSLENYASETYLNAKLDKHEFTPPADLHTPLKLRLELSDAGRAVTDSAVAVAAIRQMELANALPEIFRTEPEPADPARTAPYEFHEPFSTEWRYRITPPAGFRLRELPKDATQKLGPASYSSRFAANPDGTVAATFHFNSGPALLSPADGAALRTAVLAFVKAEPTLIYFDQSGELLLSKGDVKGALAEFRALAAKDPKDALPRTRAAGALLKAGLAEAARAEALEATRIAPKSAHAWHVLGNVRTYDLAGRFRTAGMDRPGALAAFRKAIELEPDRWTAHMDLAITLEHDANGYRYAAKDGLTEAIEVYKRIDEEKSNLPITENLLFALFHAGRFQELADTAPTRKSTAKTRMLLVAARAMLEGTPAALRQAQSITVDTERTESLNTAGRLVAQRRNYPVAADLIAAAAQGSPNGAQLLNFANALRNSRILDQIVPGPSDPAGVPLRLLAIMMGEAEPGIQDILPLLSEDLRATTAKEGPAAFNKIMGASRQQLRRQTAAANLPIHVIGDLIFNNVQIAKEGDDASGYRIRMVPVNGGQNAATTFYVGKFPAGYRIIGIESSPGDMTQEITRRVKSGDLPGARRLLDWLRESSKRAGGEDPLDGPAFPYFWERGQKGADADILLAAATLDPESKDALALISKARDAAPQSARLRFHHAIALAAIKQRNAGVLLSAARAAKAAHPTSESAFQWEGTALNRLQRFPEAEALVEQRLKQFPNDPLALRSSMANALSQRQLPRARKALESLIAAGQAAPLDYNAIAWAELDETGATAHAIEASQKSVQGASASFGYLHTLAALYADSGRITEAREYLVKAMHEGDLTEPNDACWLVLGWVAERLDLTPVARGLYQRVAKPESDEAATDPYSNYAVAQRRLAQLR